MWTDSPQTLQQQIRDEFRQCRTPAGCVVTKRERREVAESDEGWRELRKNVTGQKPAD